MLNGYTASAVGLLCISVSALLTATVAGQHEPLPQDTLVLVNGHLVNVADGSIASSTRIVLRAGRVDMVNGPAPAGATAIDLRGRYVLPGLIDAHVHIEDLRGLRAALEGGVTTARSGGVSHYADVGLRELVRSGAVAGPDMLASGYHLRPSLAEPAFLDHPGLASFLSRRVTTADALRDVVRANASRGVDWIKVMATERAGTPDTDPRRQVYTEAELRAVVEEAAGRNLPVLAHAHGEEGALAAVKAGVRSIEHGTYLAQGALDLMARQGTFLIPTIDVIKDMTGPGGDYDGPELQLRGRLMLPRLCETVKRAHAAGVAIGAGSDSGYRRTSVGRLNTEVANLVECGLPPLAALQAATIVNARLLRRENATGQLAPGFEADLLVVERNPLEEIGTLQDPLLVISNGRIGLDRLSFARSPAPLR